MKYYLTNFSLIAVVIEDLNDANLEATIKHLRKSLGIIAI